MIHLRVSRRCLSPLFLQLFHHLLAALVGFLAVKCRAALAAFAVSSERELEHTSADIAFFRASKGYTEMPAHIGVSKSGFFLLNPVFQCIPLPRPQHKN